MGGVAEKEKANHQLATQYNKGEHKLALYLSVPYIDSKEKITL